MKTILEKYADLLVHYCMEIKPGDKLFIKTTILAEPLLREVFRSAIRAGATVDTELEFREQNRIFFQEAQPAQLSRVSPLYQLAMETYDAYLHIRAPFNLGESNGSTAEKTQIHQQAYQKASDAYFRRTATRELKRNLCQFPTQASAQKAGLSLEEYEHFVFNACKLNDPDPIESWIKVRQNQQRIVDHLNKSSEIHYKGEGIDLTFSCRGRTWMNSDGQTNMPSGEVYTSPVEDSVNGMVRFSLPALYGNDEVEGATLYVKDGYIEKWEASKGIEVLDRVFKIEGTRRFGEAAIGTNYDIDRMTKNILFDEKIGGTVHLAIGQSYLQTGGKNQSAVHWDMITDMRKGGEIFTDGEKIYENGHFTI